MKNTSPYLDIYKEGEIIIQCSGNFKDEIEKDHFFNYLKFLKERNISFSLVNEKGDQISNYFFEKNNFNFQEKRSDNVKNILLLENNIELKNKKGEIIKFVSKEKLEEMLENNNLGINLRNKLEEILKLLREGFSKVTMCSIDGLKEELEGFGSGTMFVNLEKAKFTKLKNRELFDEIYKKLLIAGNWKKREADELTDIFNNYTVLEIDGTILGGYALRDYKIEINQEIKTGKILENFFSSRNKGGIGSKLMEIIKKEDLVFAYSKKEEVFTKLGFQKIKGITSETGADLWFYQKNY